jgi:hypothetical protein
MDLYDLLQPRPSSWRDIVAPQMLLEHIIGMIKASYPTPEGRASVREQIMDLVRRYTREKSLCDHLCSLEPVYAELGLRYYICISGHHRSRLYLCVPVERLGELMPADIEQIRATPEMLASHPEHHAHLQNVLNKGR